MKDFWNKNRSYFILIGIVLLGYFQLSFFLKTLKFDALYVHYPWRYIIVENLRSGVLPLWNFFQHLGLPIHADPQSGAWYPIVWIFALFGKYSLYSFNIEFILHIVIAVLGFYSLLRKFSVGETAAIMGSIAYVFSGFFVGHAAHYTWIISIAWIPWIFYFFKDLLDFPNFSTSLKLTLVLYMLLSGGYPAFSIILFYVLFVWAVWELFTSKNKGKLILFWAIVVFLFMALSLVYLLSVYDSLDYFTRGHGVEYQFASQYALNYKTLVSLLVPFAVASVDNQQILEVFGTDLSMANLYLGFLPLLLAMVYFLRKRKHLLWIILAMFFLGVSMGDSLGIHPLLFKYLPLFDLFRFPAFFRYFFMFILIFFAAKQFDNLLNSSILSRFKWMILGILSLGFFLLLYAFFYQEIALDFNHGLRQLVLNSSVSQRLFFMGIVQWILLLFAYFILIWSKRKKISLLILIIFDLLLNFQLNAPFTCYAARSNVAQSQYVLDSISLPLRWKNNQNIYKNTIEGIKLYGFDKSLNVYEGKVAYDGNYSFLLSNTQVLMDSLPELFAESIKNPLIFTGIGKNELWKNRTIFHVKNDSNAMIERFESRPNALEFKIDINQDETVVLLQNYYPGWRAFVDGKEEKILISNHTFMAVELKKGLHQVRFSYEPKKIKGAFWISSGTLVLIFMALAFFYVRKKIPIFTS